MPIWVRDYKKDTKKKQREVDAAKAEGRRARPIPIRKEVHIRMDLPGGDNYEKRLVPGFTSESAAHRWAEQHIANVLKAGRPQRNRTSVPTLIDFERVYIEEYCEAERQKPTTIATKRSLFKEHLLPVMGHKRLDEIGLEDVQKLKKRMEATSISHTNNGLSTLNTALDFAVGLELIPRLDFKIRLLKLPENEMAFYDFEEFERLAEAAAKEDPRILAVVLLGGEAGLRRGEILALTQGRARFDRNVLVIAQAVSKNVHTTTKTGNVREVPMSGRLRAALEDLKHLRGDLVLYRDDGEPATGRVLQRWIERAERRARMDVTGRLHILRHTFCSHMAMQGVPVRTIQYLAGHASITTTMRYMHLSPEAREEGIRALERRRQEPPGSGANREAAFGEKKTP